MTTGQHFRQVRHLVLSGLASFRLWVVIFVGATLTWVLASTGIDAGVNDIARLQNDTVSVAWSAFPMLAGILAPAIVPIILVLLKRNSEALMTAAAFIAALIVVTLLKGFTSRVHPEALEPATSLLRSQEFRFGFLQNGISSIIEGWPSGHIATNGAVALTLAANTNSARERQLSIFWFVWVALATVFGISGDVHWLSDTIAGGLIAWVVSQQMVKAKSGKNIVRPHSKPE